MLLPPVRKNLGMVVTSQYNILAAASRSIGDTRTPLLCLIAGSLANVGLDFLYECKDCRIVTAGRASELPEFTNVRIKKRVFEKVDSLEALQAAAGETRLPVSVSKWWKRDRM